MADNTVQGGTDTIATDDVTTMNGVASSGVKVAREKVGFGTDGTYRDVDASNPLPVYLGVGTNDLGSVVAREAQSWYYVDVPGTSTAIYASGDQFGTLMTLTNAVRVAGGTGRINSILFYDENDVMGGVSVVFYRDTVTLAADNAANTLSAADVLDVIFVADLVSINDMGSGRFAQLVTSVPFDCAGTSLYVSIITRTTPTVTTPAKQHLRIGITRD